MKKSKRTKDLLNTLAAARGKHRDLLVRPRSAVFKDRTKYNRQRHKHETRRESEEN